MASRLDFTKIANGRSKVIHRWNDTDYMFPVMAYIMIDARTTAMTPKRQPITGPMHRIWRAAGELSSETVWRLRESCVRTEE